MFRYLPEFSDSMDQLELALGSPYTVRLPISEALSLFWREDWQHTVKARQTKIVFERLREFFVLEGLSYVDEVSKASIEALRRWLREEVGLKDNTINGYHMILTRMFNFLNEFKERKHDFKNVILPSRNPGSQVRKVNEDKFARNVAWPKKTIKKLIRKAVEIGDLGLAEIIEFLYHHPIRLCDLFRLTEKNVNLPRMVITGIQNKTITRKNPSGVPYLNTLTKRGAAILSRRLETYGPNEPLFQKRNLQKRWKALRSYAGIPGIWLKDLRPSAGTLLLDNGTDPETVKNVLGHTTLRMLPAYVIRTTAHLRKASEKLADEKTEIVGVK